MARDKPLELEKKSGWEDFGEKSMYGDFSDFVHVFLSYEWKKTIFKLKSLFRNLLGRNNEATSVKFH